MVAKLKCGCGSEVVGGRIESVGRQSGGGVGANGPAEEENVGLGPVYFVVLPAARLLDAQGAPLVLGEELALGLDLLENVLGKDDVAVLVVGVAVLLGVLNFAGVVRHQLYYSNL